MKKIFKLFPVLLLASIALFSFTSPDVAGIKGTIAPADGATSVWAIAGEDSAKSEIVDGSFQFADIKAGTYKIVVDAKAPYKKFEKENVVVNDGEVVDLGTITLEQ